LTASFTGPRGGETYTETGPPLIEVLISTVEDGVAQPQPRLVVDGTSREAVTSPVSWCCRSRVC